MRAERTIRTAYDMCAFPEAAHARVLVPQQTVAAEPDGRLHDHRSNEQLRKRERGREEQDEAPCERCCEPETHCLGAHNANDDGELREYALGAFQQDSVRRQRMY